jgi:hypothetical protein
MNRTENPRVGNIVGKKERFSKGQKLIQNRITLITVGLYYSQCRFLSKLVGNQVGNRKKPNEKEVRFFV